MKLILYNLYRSLVSNYKNRQWLQLILKLIGLAVSTACMFLMIGTVVLAVFSHIDEIVVTIGAIACFFWGIAHIFTRTDTPPSIETILEYDPITLESTYKLLRKNLCSIIGDIAEITKLRKPTTLSQLDTPTHFDVKAKAVIYHFIIPKQSEEVDTFSTLGILQNAIEQRLNNHEVEGITQTVFFYNGQAYPSIMVDNVLNLGNFIQIDIAIASEYYCKYREQRIYNNMNQTGIIKPMDKDF